MGLLTQTRQLLLYTLWADRVLLDAARGVSPEHLTRDAGVSFGSMLGTLSHVLGSQRRWLARFVGQDSAISDPAFPNAEGLAAGWSETASQLEFFLASLTEDQLAAEITWTNDRGEVITRPLWQPVFHMVNHSTYHRGQVVSLMRQMGYQPPKTDLIHFFLK
ncbi:MAG TPA: DinB family protein [Thermoanaerobaculia bacterium]|jgi:uncharacterized damage-inducible protein DinB|nr:DinB family protein [Thermoanaerobaculia bacterium]